MVAGKNISWILLPLSLFSSSFNIKANMKNNKSGKEISVIFLKMGMVKNIKVVGKFIHPCIFAG